MFDGRSGAGRKEYRWKRASASVFVRFFGKRTGSSASSNSTSAQESAPAMAVSAAGAPLGSEQMDFENSALGELAEEDMLDGMGGLCYDSDEMYDEEEKGEGRQGVPTHLFGVGEASAGPSALTRDEGEVLGAGVGTGATGGNAGATGAGASASAGELPAPPACEPHPREGGSSSAPPLRAPTPLEMLISNARELVTSLVRTRAPGPDGPVTSQSNLAAQIGWRSQDISAFMTGNSASRKGAIHDRTALGNRARCLIADFKRKGFTASPSAEASPQGEVTLTLPLTLTLLYLQP